MIELQTKVRKWGNSLSIVIPLNKVKKEDIGEGTEINVLIQKKENVLRETFGTFKFKKSVQKMMYEIDNELYND